MAILHFPLGSHLGKLTWENETEKLTSVANRKRILYTTLYGI